MAAGASIMTLDTGIGLAIIGFMLGAIFMFWLMYDWL